LMGTKKIKLELKLERHLLLNLNGERFKTFQILKSIIQNRISDLLTSISKLCR
jgi:hypothetical protein